MVDRPRDRLGALSGVSEAPVELVWNKGIARLCDRRFPDEFPDGMTYTPVSTLAGDRISAELPADVIADPASHADIAKGEIVWVRLSWLPAFVRQVLPLVRAPFVLATADSDSSVPRDLPELAREILASPYVIRWFTQNYDGAAAERMAPLPIGIDFHSVSEKAIWGEGRASPREQEIQLETIARALPPLERRDPGLYLDFAWNFSRRRAYLDLMWPLPVDGNDRAPATARLPEGRKTIVRKLRWRRAVVCQKTRLPRAEMWRRRGRYAAVVSPHGGGLDCHRTWEALALGHLVVVPSSSLDPLFEGLRVWPVSDWDEVRAKNLARRLSALVGPAAKDPLTSRYWIERMRAAAAGA
jgi:hypothetical protein